MRRLSILFIVISVLALILSGCGESNSAKLDRLEKDAAVKRQAAAEARENYNQLKDFVDKYGK